MKFPGLVDLQVNGYNGVDFSSPDLTKEQFIRACKELLEAGATAFLPTMVTSPRHVYEHNLPLIAQAAAQPELKNQVLGIHIEGPFISKVDGARGAHNLEWILEPNIDLLKKMIDWSNGTIKLLTIAAELKGSAELARFATSQGITVALGHQMATEQDIENLVQAGATALTHLGNGIPSKIDRHNNPLFAGLANDNLFATIIADGNHIPPSLLKTIILTKSPEKCIVISDATMLAGFEPGEYESMNQKVILEDSGKLYNPKTGYLAGSSATILKCMNHLASLNFLNPNHLLQMGFENPLRLIGLNPEAFAGDNKIHFNESSRTFHCKNNN